ncbi:MAG: isoprenylcysteine carboxylmethyltransferase family protein [Defluviicoccus sp.]
MGSCQWVALLVTLQRLAEVVFAERNRRRLLVRGGTEVGAGHFPLFFLVHGGWLISLAVLVPADAPIVWPWLSVFLALQPLRLWVIASLGERWTTRIIIVPGAPLVSRGPYRLVRHPNYLIVALEIALLPLAFDAPAIAVVFSLANALLLHHRIRIEEAALSGLRNR